MSDPFMNNLFDISHKDTNVPAEEHGRRLGLFFLDHYGDDREYSQTRGPEHVHNLETAHIRSKKCPFRGKKLQGKGFTYNQVFTWLGYMSINIERRGI